LLVEFFVKQQKALRNQITDKTAMLATMKTLITERELWQKRDQWLAKEQPKLTNPSGAGVELLEQIKTLGQNRSIIPTEAVIGTPESAGKMGGREQDQSVSLTFNAKGKWENMVDFFYDLQSPTNFIVFSKALIRVDKEDKTQIAGTFTVAKWYAAK
jgi:hypothetical protein